MTDSQMPSELNGDAVSHEERTEARTFRASTLDEAVAVARAELGPDVELVQASRVRRGGLGGFFATDLGVEVLVRRTDAVADSETEIAARDDRFAAATTSDLADTIGSLTPAMEISSDFARVMAAADREVGATMETPVEIRSSELAMAGVASMHAGAHSDSDQQLASPGEGRYESAADVASVDSADHAQSSVAGQAGSGVPMDSIESIGSMPTEPYSDASTESPELVGELPMTAAEASVQTALDRLIEHAESIDRPIPPAHAHIASSRSALGPETSPMPIGTRRPMLPDDDFWNPRETAEAADIVELASEEVDDAALSLVDAEPALDESAGTEPQSSEADADPDRLSELEEQLRADLAATPTRSELSETLTTDLDDTVELPRPLAPRFDDEQDAETGELLDQPVETGLLDQPGEAEIVEEPTPASTVSSAPSELAPPSALLNPQLAEAETAVDELDAMLRSVGIDVDVARLGGDSIERLSSTIPLATDTGQPTAGELAELAQQRLVDGVASLSRGANAPVVMLAVTITSADGTSVSMSTQLAEDDEFLVNDALMGASTPNLQLVPDFDD